MATQQLLRQKKKSSKAAVLFPEAIATEQQSAVLVKRLLAISVSCVTYMRGLFPESSYGTRYLDDLCLKILREDQSCLGSLQIVKWIQGCFDALDKQYLHMAVLAIYTNPKEPEVLTELYQFKFKYEKKVPQMDISSNHSEFVSGPRSEEIKQASRLLLRRLYLLMQNLGPLPNDVTLTMKLLYYNDVTPKDYQPPGFKEDASPGDLVFAGEPVSLRVGSVSTDFHLLKVRVITEKKRIRKAHSKLIQKNGPTEISHQGLDCEEEEEGGTKNHPLSVRKDSSDHEGNQKDTYPGMKTEASSFCLQDTGRKKKVGIEETGRMPCSRASQQNVFTWESQVLTESYPFLATSLGWEELSPAGQISENHQPCHLILLPFKLAESHVSLNGQKLHLYRIKLLNLAFSQEEVTGPEKKRKVSEPEKLPLNSRKLCSF